MRWGRIKERKQCRVAQSKTHKAWESWQGHRWYLDLEFREMAKCRGLAGGRGAGWVQGTDPEDTENWEVHANWPFGNLPS